MCRRLGEGLGLCMIKGKEAGMDRESCDAVSASPVGALQSKDCLLEEATWAEMSRPWYPRQASHWLGLLRYTVTWAQCDIVKVLTTTFSPHRWTVNAFQREV